LTPFEALSKIAHRLSNSENERKELEAVFLEHFGTDEEKKRLYQESEADKAEREAKERFDAAVQAEVEKRNKAAAESKAVSDAADKAQQEASSSSAS
jgi:hypothetical protein